MAHGLSAPSRSALAALAIATVTALLLLQHRRHRRRPPAAGAATSSAAAAPRYVIVDKVRTAVPYECRHTYRIKPHQADHPAAAILQSMFGQPLAHWERQVEEGRVVESCTSAGRELHVLHHVHEPAVISTDVGIIYEDEELLVVDKPAGVATLDNAPVVGRNTCVGLAQAVLDSRPCAEAAARDSQEWRRLIAVHRLDKPVGGVLILAKATRAKYNVAARKFAKLIERREVEKVYVARVAGAFPPGETLCSEPLSWVGAEARATVDAAGGKPSSTRFTRLRGGRATSLVRCEPLTGRTHQIRAHLAALGHPVANDATYGGTLTAPGPGEPNARELRVHADDGERTLASTLAREQRDWCRACAQRAAAVARANAAPERHEESEVGEELHVSRGIWLHSLRYSFPTLGRVFESAPPRFMRDEFDEV